MSISISIIKTDDYSRAALSTIFDPINVEGCANYGGGSHCNPERITKKIELWGKRGDDAVSENQCMLARIISVDEEPAAMFNIGKTGNTVIDRTQAQDNFVYEISGLMFRDKFFTNVENEGIAQAIESFMSTCKADDNYTKLISVFLPTHPYQEVFLSTAGGVKLTTENLVEQLGRNSLHPERFKFEGEQLQECSKWAEQGTERVQHDGWHDSEACMAWVDKTAYVFNISAGHIEVTGLSADGTVVSA